METTAIEVYSNHRKRLDKELKEFVSTYTGSYPKGIKALASKIDHMCNNIGCPSSVLPMLHAILRGTKRLYFEDSTPAGTSSTGYKENGVGHFKWDWKVYTLTEDGLNHIRNFYFKGNMLTMERDPHSEYDQQAETLLNSLNATMTCKLLSKGKYFSDDKEERNIYEITLTRGQKQYIFTFGQSIVDTGKGIVPSVYDILSYLQKYDPGTFENFCSDFGYDEDSRSAEKTYNAVKDEWMNVQALFTEAELELLQEIQ